MKVAIVLTVKNEVRLLRNNILYHRALGASHIFVYFDGTADDGKQSIADLDFVTIQDSVPAAQYAHLPYLKKFTSQAIEHHTARQCLNTYSAQQLCKTLKYDWLVSLDADELVCPDPKKIIGLPAFFSSIDIAIDVVYLQTREALQHRISCENVFAEEVLFKTTPTYRNRFKNITKAFYNPFTKQEQQFSFWYGQTMGKGALRIDRDIIPHNVHRYKLVDGGGVKNLTNGLILHYHAYDAQDFMKKFTNFAKHPDTFLSGNSVENIKLLLRDVVNSSGLSHEELTQYFKDNVMFSAAEVLQLQKNRYLGLFKRNPTPLQEITSVQQVFETKINLS